MNYKGQQSVCFYPHPQYPKDGGNLNLQFVVGTLSLKT